MEIDLNESGLRLVFNDYQEEAMKLLWGDVEYLGGAKETRAWEKKEFSSREVHMHLNKALPAAKERDSVSRASVINFLNDMATKDILGFHEITGKGGHRRIYHAQLSKTQFWDKVFVLVSEKLAAASHR